MGCALRWGIDHTRLAWSRVSMMSVLKLLLCKSARVHTLHIHISISVHDLKADMQLVNWMINRGRLQWPVNCLAISANSVRFLPHSVFTGARQLIRDLLPKQTTEAEVAIAVVQVHTHVCAPSHNSIFNTIHFEIWIQMLHIQTLKGVTDGSFYVQ